MSNPNEKPGHAEPYRFERLIMLGLAIALVTAMVAFVVWNPQLGREARVVLFVLVALAAGGFIAFLPGGALNIGNTFKGVTIKAAGGAAAFLIVLYLLFTYGPDERPPAIAPLASIDLRSEFPKVDPRHAAGAAALIVPIAFKSSDGAPVQIRSLRASLDLGTTPVAQFVARHATVLREGVSEGEWLPFLGDIQPDAAFVEGPAVEIAFYASDGVRWSGLLKRMAEAGTRLGTVNVTATLPNGSSITASCRFELDRLDGSVLSDLVEAAPSYIAKECTK